MAMNILFYFIHPNHPNHQARGWLHWGLVLLEIFLAWWRRAWSLHHHHHLLHHLHHNHNNHHLHGHLRGKKCSNPLSPVSPFPRSLLGFIFSVKVSVHLSFARNFGRKFKIAQLYQLRVVFPVLLSSSILCCFLDVGCGRHLNHYWINAANFVTLQSFSTLVLLGHF